MYSSQLPFSSHAKAHKQSHGLSTGNSMSLQIYHPSDRQAKLEAFVRSQEQFTLGFLQPITGEFLTWRYLDHSCSLTDELHKGSSMICHLRNILKTIEVIESPLIYFSNLWILFFIFLIFSFKYIVFFTLNI